MAYSFSAFDLSSEHFDLESCQTFLCALGPGVVAKIHVVNLSIKNVEVRM